MLKIGNGIKAILLGLMSFGVVAGSLHADRNSMILGLVASVVGVAAAIYYGSLASREGSQHVRQGEELLRQEIEDEYGCDKEGADEEFKTELRWDRALEMVGYTLGMVTALIVCSIICGYFGVNLL